MNNLVKHFELAFQSLDKASLKTFSMTSSANSLAKLNIGMVSNKDDLIEALFLRGQSLLQLDRFQDAYFSFIKVISIDPNNAQVIVVLQLRNSLPSEQI